MGMGTGYMSGLLVGKALGAMMGMPKDTQDKLKTTGMWAGVIANIIPKAFGGMTADVDLAATAEAAEMFLADGLVVTGSATGRAADPDDVQALCAAVSVPTLVGSGVTADNLHRYAAADALIVGSSLKQKGVWSNPIDPARLEALTRAFDELPPPEGASQTAS